MQTDLCILVDIQAGHPLRAIERRAGRKLTFHEYVHYLASKHARQELARAARQPRRSRTGSKCARDAAGSQTDPSEAP